MRILVTNDDGVHAPGIALLARVAADYGQVFVVAPSHEMSAVSHGLTLHRPLRTRAAGAEGWWMVDGTPADCVYIGVHHLLSPRPDLVLSGINHGPNLGYDVFYSGTVAGAREACLQGIPALAFSVYGDRHPLHPHVEGAIRLALDRTLAARVDDRPFCVNVNVPNEAGQTPRGLRLTRLGRQIFSPQVERRTDPRGLEYFWIGSDRVAPPEEGDTDLAAVKAGFVSVTPLGTDTTDVDGLARLAGLEASTPRSTP